MLTAKQVAILAEYENEKPAFSTVWINGNKISGYFSYGYHAVKEYVKEPERADNGSIQNLNSYATFIVPSLTISFKYMPISTYRTIMKLIYSMNEFTIKCYDTVYDKMVTFKAYFKPEDSPELFIKSRRLLGVIDYEISLVGTLSSADTINIVYHLNPPADSGVSDQTQGSEDFNNGEEVIIGDNITLKDTAINGFKFAKWNSQADGKGFNYIDGQAYTITMQDENNKTLDLYAVWESDLTFTLSYNYGYGQTALDENNEELYNKTIVYGETYGNLPTTTPLPVEYKDEEYNPYIALGWYKTPKYTSTSTKISSTDIYNIKGNTTIYQLFDVLSYTITYDSKGGDYTPKTVTQKYDSSIYEPPEPKKEGSSFGGWYTSESYSSDSKFVFTTMPPKNIKLYAKWE